jgi:hypothetical protein
MRAMVELLSLIGRKDIIKGLIESNPSGYNGEFRQFFMKYCMEKAKEYDTVVPKELLGHIHIALLVADHIDEIVMGKPLSIQDLDNKTRLTLSRIVPTSRLYEDPCWEKSHVQHFELALENRQQNCEIRSGDFDKPGIRIRDCIDIFLEKIYNPQYRNHNIV